MSPRGIAAVARDEPGRIAIICGDRRETFAELDADANRWAHLFAGAGVGHGDRVAVMLGNRPEVFAAWAGASRLGALVVPVSYRFTVAEVAYILADSQTAAFVYEDEMCIRDRPPPSRPVPRWSPGPAPRSRRR